MSRRLLATNYVLRFAVSLVDRGLSLLIFPALIAFLGVEGYGYYTLAVSATAIYVAILSVRLPLAMIRFYPDRRESAGPVVAVGLGLWLVLLGISTVGVALFGNELSQYLFNTQSMTKLVAASLASGLCFVLYDVVSVTRSAENRFGLLSLIDTVERISYIGLCLLVLWLGYISVEAVIALLAVTTLGKVLLISWPSLKGVRWAWPSLDLIKRMFLFALPHVPYVASNWVIERSAAFFVAETLGIKAAGMFGIAMALAFLMGAVIGHIQTVLYPMVRKSHDDGREGVTRDLLTTAMRAILLVCGFGTICVSLGADSLFTIMRIRSATPDMILVFLLSLAFTANAIRAVMVNIISIERQTRVLLWICPLGAMSSLIFYLVFMNYASLVFAAFGMALGNSVQVALMAGRVSRRLLPIPPRQFFFALAVGLSAAAGIQWWGRTLGAWPYVAALLVSGTAYAGIAYECGALSPDEKRAVLRLMRQRKAKMASVIPGHAR